MRQHQLTNWLIGSFSPALGLAQWVGGSAVVAAIVLASPMASAAVLSGWSFEASSNQLSITLPQGVTPRFLVFAEPARIVLEVPNTQISGPITTAQTYQGAVRKVEVVQEDANTVHIVMELAPNTVIDRRHAELASVADNGQTRWTLTPLIVDSTAPIAQAPATSEPAAAAPSQVPMPPAAASAAPAQPAETAGVPDLPSLPESAPAAASPAIEESAEVAVQPPTASPSDPPASTAPVMPPKPSAEIAVQPADASQAAPPAQPTPTVATPTGPRFIETPEGQLSIRASNLMLAAPGDSLSDLPNTLPIDPFQANAAAAAGQVAVPPLDGAVAANSSAPQVTVPPLGSLPTAPAAATSAGTALADPVIAQAPGEIVTSPPNISNPAGSAPAATTSPGITPPTPAAESAPPEAVIASSPPSSAPVPSPAVSAPAAAIPLEVTPPAAIAQPPVVASAPLTTATPAVGPASESQPAPNEEPPAADVAAIPGPQVAAPVITEAPPFLETAPASAPPVAAPSVATPDIAALPPVAPETLAQAPATPLMQSPPPFIAAAPATVQPATAPGAIVVPPPNVVAGKLPVAPAATAPAEPVPFLNSVPSSAPLLAATPDENAITFGQPLPAAGVKENLPSFPYITPSGETHSQNPNLVIPAGTLLKLRYTGQQPLRIDQNTTTDQVLLLETELRDARTGAVIAPAGSQISGNFGPDDLGQRWVSQSLILPGRQVPLTSASAYFAGPPQVSGQSLAVNSGIGALALTVLTGFTGIGLIGGAILGATTAVGTAPQAIVIEPNQIIEVQVLADVTRSTFQPPAPDLR